MSPGALLTDLYELTMLHAYWMRGMDRTAVFEFFVRRLPPSRNFLIAAGLEQALEYLEGLRFSPEELAWVEACGRFRPGFSDWLASLRFTGDVDAMPEGTAFFAEEPILRVTAPLPEAQLVETRLVNLLHFETLVASKAARCVLAARGKPLVDFGLRRAHGAEAGLLAARAAYLAGFAGTSAVEAGRLFGIPLFGTMAHSFVQAYADESEAFADFARATPADATLLVDTYDTEAAAQKAADLAVALRAQGLAVKGVRLDSGDLAEHARRVRAILDRGGGREMTVFASGNLDELAVERLASRGAPIDGYGVGTAVVTSGDAPSLDCVYKLQEYAGRARRKRSEGKTTWPGRKQVWRRRGADGVPLEDVLAVEGDAAGGEPLLVPVLRSGRRVGPRVPLGESRARARDALATLPESLRSLRAPAAYRVSVSAALRELAARVDRETAEGTALGA